MKRKILTGIILAVLSFGLMTPTYADLWKKRVVQHSESEYDIHLSLPAKADKADDEYEKELLVFISNKAVESGYNHFTFTVDATDKDVLVVHVQNFKSKPKSDLKENQTAVQYFDANNILQVH